MDECKPLVQVDFALAAKYYRMVGRCRFKPVDTNLTLKDLIMTKWVKPPRHLATSST